MARRHGRASVTPTTARSSSFTYSRYVTFSRTARSLACTAATSTILRAASIWPTVTLQSPMRRTFPSFCSALHKSDYERKRTELEGLPEDHRHSLTRARHIPMAVASHGFCDIRDNGALIRIDLDVDILEARPGRFG